MGYLFADILARTIDNVYIVDRFTVPSRKFNIRVNYTGRHVHPMEVLLPRQLAFRSLLPHCTTVSLVAFDTVSMTAFDPHGVYSSALESSEEFSIDQPQAPVFTEALWMSILDVFSPAPLSRFHLEYYFPPDISPATWSALFGRFFLEAVEARFCGTRDDRGRTLLPGLDNLFAALRDPAAHRVRSLGLHRPVLNPSTAGAIFGLLEDRASLGVPLERLDLVHSFCEDSVDPWELTSRLRRCTDLTVSIRYGRRAAESDELRSFHPGPEDDELVKLVCNSDDTVTPNDLRWLIIAPHADDGSDTPGVGKYMSTVMC